MKSSIAGIWLALLLIVGSGCGTVSGGNDASSSGGSGGASATGGSTGTGGKGGATESGGAAGTGGPICHADATCSSCPNTACCGSGCCGPGEWCDTSGGSPTCRCGSGDACKDGNSCNAPTVNTSNPCGIICCMGRRLPRLAPELQARHPRARSRRDRTGLRRASPDRADDLSDKTNRRLRRAASASLSTTRSPRIR